MSLFVMDTTSVCVCSEDLHNQALSVAEPGGKGFLAESVSAETGGSVSRACRHSRSALRDFSRWLLFTQTPGTLFPLRLQGRCSGMGRPGPDGLFSIV
jgi:hypothetical protein